MIIRPAQSADYPAILALQAQNVPEHLSAEQRRQGFIVSTMDEAQLARINAALGILVAEAEGELAGFVCLTQANVQPRPEVVDAMLATLEPQRFDGRPINQQRYFLYGPVCLAQRWRGKGVLKQLFAAVKAHTRASYDLGFSLLTTLTRTRSPPSARAGMTTVTTFSCRGKRYYLLAFATRNAGYS
ncbi:Uncharacterised protein [Serratia rubidaea]|uniref:N-acetyltransferase domain-containing protein n=1 Tax=Serratia rubidaea TaxID=61652 RepID=A0A3S4GNA5_SERRU|nr:Uncharacterised protein [Serratia rubidaea]